jgi:hypothetical protein
MGAASNRNRDKKASRGRAGRVPDEACVLSVCEQLSKQCGGRVDRFEAAEPILFASALNAVRALEECATSGFQSDGTRKLLVGRWALVLTDSPAIVSNRGSITGLPVPGMHCIGIEVVLDQSGDAETIDKMSALGGMFAPQNVLRGKWSLSGKSGRTLEHTYEELRMLGQTLRSDSKATLLTTYVGSSVRVGRSASGNVFVFRRVPPHRPMSGKKN